MSSIYLIVCLGNPGKDYDHTRHNVGFRVGDVLVKTLSLEKKGEKFKSILYVSKHIFLIKPQTYMNLSGEAVQAVSQFYKIPVGQIIVIYDDVDLPFGDVRIRKQGSAGTHNGMKSIIQTIGTGEFPRLRIGVGPKPPGWDLSDFVLSKFTGDEEKLLPEILEKSARAVEVLISDGIEKAMAFAHS